MPLQPDATRDKCIDAAVHIVSSAITSGKLEAAKTEEVIKYFADIYHALYCIVAKKP